MSIVFSKNKEKRSRSSSSEANNSFVKNVTSRVSGLLPAAVTKWFSSPSSSNANGSAPAADATDSSTEDETMESPITTQPPLKRMRFTSPGSFNHYNATEPNCVGNDLNELESCIPLGTVQSPAGRTTFRRETNYVSTPLRPSEDTPIDRTEKDTSAFKTQHSVSCIGSSVTTKRKSLFDSPSSADASARACAKTSCNTIKDPSQPCFKPSLLGSPFYPGRTMYGGASSSYINQPNIKLRKTAVVNESSTSDNTVSHSTQRIMDLLEHYSSPLNEARRIPHYTRTPRNNTLNNTLSSSISSTSPPSNKAVSYKAQELHVPSIASILRLKQRSRLMDTTNAARQIIASHSSTSNYVPYPSNNTQKAQAEKESSNKLTTKVKSRLTRPKRGETCDVETELPAPVILPSAVLRIDQNNLPKFTFGTSPTATSTVTSKLVTSTPIVENEKPTRKPDIVTSANPYNFSSPVRIASDQSQPVESLPKFAFGSPEREKVKESKDVDLSCVVGAPKEQESKVKEKDWQCADCWVLNKPDKDLCVCCGGKKPSKHSKTPAKCTVCKLADSQPAGDKCVNCDKIKINNISKPLTKPDNSSKWKCEDCWVDNDSGKESCACCGAKNPEKSSVVKQNAVNYSNAGSEWKCDDCWIKNKSSADRCAACGSARPGAPAPAPPAGPLAAPLPKPPENTFKIIVKSQTDKWECPSCLVRNDADKTKCACCEHEKDGTKKESESKSFNFGDTNTSFKFGINPNAQVVSASKPAKVKTTTESKKEDTETNNNVLSKTPSLTFGLPAKKSEDQPDLAKKVDEKISAPKANFSFGIPKTTASAVASVSSPIFGVAKPATSTEEKEKPQVVPKVDFTIPKPQETPKPVANMFASPVPSSLPQEKSLTASLVPEKPVIITPVTNSMPAAENNLSSNPLIPQPAAAPPAPAFTFGSGGLPANLFATPAATTVTTSISFGVPMNSAPANNTTSIFQNNEPTTTMSTMSVFPKSDAASLFQKSEPPSSTGAPAPMFSFGAVNASTQPVQPEKPKFNFAFGNNNKTETQSLFKSPENKFTFGDSTENKFALSSTNTMGISSSITGGTLGGGNGLPAANSISGNILSGGNGLPANPMTGGNGLPASNTLQAPSGGMFGAAPVQKENMWSTPINNANNIFAPNANTTNALQKPSGFTFGSTPFNTNNTPPAFGGSAQSTPNMFGMNQNANSQPSMFSSPVQSQPVGHVFGSPQPTAAPMPTMGMFGSPSVGAAPTFGTPNSSVPTFESQSLTPAPAPAFNFGGQQQATGVFGFGQQVQQPQQAGGVYPFGAAPAGPQVQFNMGSAPSAMVVQRRMRKAVRRNTQR